MAKSNLTNGGEARYIEDRKMIFLQLEQITFALGKQEEKLTAMKEMNDRQHQEILNKITVIETANKVTAEISKRKARNIAIAISVMAIVVNIVISFWGTN